MKTKISYFLIVFCSVIGVIVPTKINAQQQPFNLEHPIIGFWIEPGENNTIKRGENDYTWVFDSDGTGVFGFNEFVFRIDGNILYVIFHHVPVIYIYNMYISSDRRTITIESNYKTYTLRKVV
jgi:hypothetical protein